MYTVYAYYSDDEINVKIACVPSYSEALVVAAVYAPLLKEGIIRYTMRGKLGIVGDKFSYINVASPLGDFERIDF